MKKSSQDKSATAEATSKEQKSLSLTTENNSDGQTTSPTEQEKVKRGASKRGRTTRRCSATLKEALDTILSLEVSPATVAEEVLCTPLGDKITYREAILIAQVLKATKGDNQAMSHIQRLCDAEEKGGEEEFRLEDFIT